MPAVFLAAESDPCIVRWLLCVVWHSGTWSQMNTAIYHNIIIPFTIPQPNCTNTVLTCSLYLKWLSHSSGVCSRAYVRCDAWTNIGHCVEFLNLFLDSQLNLTEVTVMLSSAAILDNYLSTIFIVY